MSLYGEGNGTPLQYSCLENPRHGGAWWAAVYGVAQSRTRLKRLHFHFSLSCIGEGNGNPLQYSCLENPMDGGAWWATVQGVAKSRTRLSDFTFTLGSEGKVSAYNAGDPGSIPGSGRSPGEGNVNPLQYSCLENPMD